MKTFKLAANMAKGVYEVYYIPPEPPVFMQNFIDELKDYFEGTKYAIVDEAEAKQIDDKYGIKWMGKLSGYSI